MKSERRAITFGDIVQQQETQEPMNRVIFGDCRDTMRDLKAQGVRVQCCVTSPPYYGLPVAFGTIEHTERAGELLGLLWQEVQRLQCDLKDALEPQSPTTADGPAALELSWVPLNKRDLNWHAHATTQLRAMHAALSAAEKTPRDPLEIEELWDEANDLREKYDEYGPEVYELFARLLERSHGIGAEHG